MNQKLTDDSCIPFGKYRGQRLGSIEAEYLLWLLDQNWCREEHPELIAYIRSNKECLEKEAAEGADEEDD